MKVRKLIFLLAISSVALPATAQDSLGFGGIYNLPGLEVTATYNPVSPLAQRFTIEEVYRLPSTFYATER